MIVPITRQSLDQADFIYSEIEKHRHLPLLEVVKPTGMVSTFSKYYMDDDCLLLNDTFPYMLIDGHLQWNVPYEQVTLGDFLETHPECLQEGIEYGTGLPVAGGHG